MILDGVLEYALKQHRQFIDRLVAVMCRKLQHRILNNIQCIFVIADGEHCLFESASLSGRKKFR